VTLTSCISHLTILYTLTMAIASDDEDWVPFTSRWGRAYCAPTKEAAKMFSDPPVLPPSEEELQAAENLLQTQLEVESLEQQLKHARQARLAQKELVFSLRAQRAPISRLPDDLLLHIFTTCLAPEPPLSISFRKSPVAPNPLHQPWYRSCILNLPLQVLISHVCKRWRRLVLGTGAFWADMKTDRSPPADHTQFQTYLDRSANALVNFAITRSDSELWGEIHHSAKRCPRLFRIFRLVGERLNSLTLDSCERTCTEVFVEFKDRLPQLRLLLLQSSSCNKGTMTPPRPTTQVFLPSLYSATFKGSLVGLHLLRLDGLKELRVDLEDLPFTTPESVLEPLRQCVKLEILCIDHFYFRTALPEGSTFEVLLPALKVLDVGHDHTATPLSWISCMVLPSLNKLCLGYMKRRRNWIEGPDFNAIWRPEDREHCFQMHSGLTTLDITYQRGFRSLQYDNRDILHTLQLVGDGALPRLQSLSIHPDDESWPRRRDASWPKVIRRAVASTLHARYVHSIPLRTLTTDPPLVSGGKRGINYAAEYANDLEERTINQMEDLHLALLFGASRVEDVEHSSRLL